jgi:flagellar hook-associated protein 3 FlgL
MNDGITSGVHAANSLASILAASAKLQTQFSTLQEQSTTGLISQDFAGIAPQAAQVLNLSAAVSQGTAYSQVISASQARASTMQTALGQIATLTSAMATQALQLVDSNAALSVTSVAQQAKQDLQQLSSLLNTQYGGAYVFAGADTGNPPVPNPTGIASSGMYTQIATAMGGLGVTPVATIVASTVASAASTAAGTTVFSTYLSTPAASVPAGGLGAAGRQVAIGDSQTVSLDYPANQNTNAVSDPAINGTGSAVRDILGSLAVLANATTTMTTAAGFATLMQHVSATLTSASGTVTQQAASLGNTQNAMTAAAAAQSASQIVLQGQISDLTNVDMASTISNMTAVNTQLQTSYQVLALAKSLNLASFL